MDPRAIPEAGIEDGYREYRAPKRVGDDRDLVILTHLRDLAGELIRLPPAAGQILHVLVECGDNRSEAARRLYPGPKDNNRAQVSRIRGRMVEAGRILFEGLLKLRAQAAKPLDLLQNLDALKSGRLSLPRDSQALLMAAAREASEIGWLLSDHPEFREAGGNLIDAAAQAVRHTPKVP